MKMFDSAEKREQNPEFTIMLDKNPLIHRGFSNDGHNVYRETPIRPVDTGKDPGDRGGYQDSVILPPGTLHRTLYADAPRKIVEMMDLYQYGSDLLKERSRNFYVQGKFMEDYEDDAPLPDDYRHYFLTYHDLNVRQLRGYFAWRTRLRHGKMQPIGESFAYMHFFELLNGIGTASPDDAFQKMKEFAAGFPGMKKYTGMQRNVRRWMFDFALLNEMVPETAGAYADPYIADWDRNLAVLQKPETHTTEEIFDALAAVSGKNLEASPVLKKYREKGIRIFANAWKIALEKYSRDGRDIFSDCFGEMRETDYYPLRNAVYWEEKPHPDCDYVLSGMRSFSCRDGKWKTRHYERLLFDQQRFRAFVREADAVFRKKLKTGGYLKKNPDAEWAADFAAAAWDAEFRAEAEAARPHISIDFSELERIRRDAAVTRDSLLTEDEIETAVAEVMRGTETPEGGRREGGLNAFAGDSPALDHHLSAIAEEDTISDNRGITPFGENIYANNHQRSPDEGSVPPENEQNAFYEKDILAEEQKPHNNARSIGARTTVSEKAGRANDLTAGSVAGTRMQKKQGNRTAASSAAKATMFEILGLLLRGESADEYMTAHHLMPSAEVDAINEAFFDEIGDSILEYDGTHTSIMEDYREDVIRLVMQEEKEGE